MKKTLIIALGALVLSGCAYDYYRGDTRYTQYGEDCIYKTSENGYRFNNEIKTLDADKRIVYRKTACKDLYEMDTYEQRYNRENLRSVNNSVPAVATVCPMEQKAATCTKTCGQVPVMKRRYVIVPM